MRTDLIFYMDLIMEEDKPKMKFYSVNVNDRAQFWVSNPKAKMISEKDFKAAMAQAQSSH